ncbi:MAG: MBL fold metallo-hydrolase [Clostridia bacterium]|nr:MBL fold metallo-hydrolase [Clostridia bacterium]
MNDIRQLVNSISVNTQSSIRIEWEGEVYYVDPIEITEAPHDAGFILLTHDHFDHFDPESIAKLTNEYTLIVCPVGMEAKVRAAVGKLDILTVVPGQFYEDGPLEVDTVPAYNIDKDFHPEEAGWVGYIFHLGDLRLYVSGDTDDTDEARDVSADIAMVPIGGTYTMTPEEAADLINEMAPEIVIPTHYGTGVGNASDGETFAALVDEGTEVVLKL